MRKARAVVRLNQSDVVVMVATSWRRKTPLVCLPTVEALPANATGWHEVRVVSPRIGRTSVGFAIDAHVLPAADEEAPPHWLG